MKRAALILAIAAGAALLLLMWFQGSDGKSRLASISGFTVAGNTDSSKVTSTESTPAKTHGLKATQSTFSPTTRLPTTRPIQPVTRFKEPTKDSNEVQIIFPPATRPMPPVNHIPAKNLNTEKPNSPQLHSERVFNEKTQSVVSSKGTVVKNPDSPALIPFMGDYNCSDRYCTEFLSGVDLSRPRCSPRVKDFSGDCHFMNGKNRPTVFLISYPGSGNTWVRGLLEQATGICTGAVYCDGSLKHGGFNGEGLQSGTVLVTKTHGVKKHGPGIVLVRNPLDAYVAEWNRRNSRGHVGYANQHTFGSNPKWNSFVHHFSLSPWISYFKWIIQQGKSGQPFLVVKYEDIISDKLTELKRMLDFLKVPYSDEALEERMNQDFRRFHRKHKNSSNFNHYTLEQRDHLKGLVREAIDLLKKENAGILYGIEQYLH